MTAEGGVPDRPAGSNEIGRALADAFLEASREHLREKAGRLEVCLARLTPEQVWSRAHEVENAVGNLVLHLCGNVRQWILSGLGGEPDDRDRDAEFDRRVPLSAEELLDRLHRVVDGADSVMARLGPEDLLVRRRIQVYEDVTALYAIYHVVEHFSQHTAQVIWITKRLTGQDLGFYGYLARETERIEDGDRP